MENPTNRYETVLDRRSIRKHTNGVQLQGQERGDISLGFAMKIIAGKVIVKTVKPELIDGSATPAALSKMQRGDVILSLNGKSLVLGRTDRNMSPEDRTAALLKMLEPLISPNEEDGVYEKTVHLELARGEGLRLLEREEAKEERQRLAVASNNNGRRSWRFGMGGRTAASMEEEGYATLETDVPPPSNNGNRRVGGAAAVAGIAGLALMGPITAVVAAGGAAVAVAANNKAKREKTTNNIK